MIATMAAALRRRLRDPQERFFAAALCSLSVLGAWFRVSGLSNGALFRDDAWVALTRRVPLHEAWHMVGTAPGFVLFERFWVGLDPSATWWAQLPTLVVSILAIPVVALVARWWGLNTWAALLCAVLIATSRIDVQYATHLKPYAHDVLAATLVLAAAQYWRRGKSPWPFAVISIVALATSFTIAPLVAGCAVVLAIEGWRTKRLANLLAPSLLLLVSVGGLYLSVRGGISPRLRSSWAPNFVSYVSLHGFGHSIVTMINGLVWGFSDTTPHWHLPGFSKLVIAFLLLSVALGAIRLKEATLPLAALLGALFFAAAHLAPLGTGRTDAYLYPALALLVALGVTRVATFLATLRHWAPHAMVAAVMIFAVIVTLDRSVYRPSYPGGVFTPVSTSAAQIESLGGGVLIEGTARWPWTYYNVHHVRLVFSSRYNTGFAPLSDDPRVLIMPGTVIEGGYNPARALRALAHYRTILYVRTDDWPSLGDPLARQFAAHCYVVTSRAHPRGYLLEWLVRSPSC